MDTAMTAQSYQDPITSMVTTPLRKFAPAPAPFIRPTASSGISAHSAPPLYWPTRPAPDGDAMAVPLIGADRQLHRFALGLLLTVLLLGIPLATYLAALA